MPVSFKTILVPVDFSINTEVAIYKALELADTGNAHVHLLHVTRCISRAAAQIARESAETRLAQWRACLEESHPSLKIFVWITNHSSVQRTIERIALKLQASLVVIGKRSHHSWPSLVHTVSPARLANRTGIAVLTVKPGALRNRIKTVVVPVSEAPTQAKMAILSALCKQCRVRIHLVAFAPDGQTDASEASSLLKLYQWLKNDLHCPVEHTVLHGYNKARTVLSYAKRTDADILLLNQGAETRIGWPNRELSDVLPPASKVQVLTVGRSSSDQYKMKTS
ncbi:MAG TPA: universal stress protein [Flavisolibacter sp.]|nr:universal stress protein [Flavisolibacter sp.]